MLERETPAGAYVKAEPATRITIRIEGHSLHFYRDADFWWDTTFTLPARTDPPQLHATIQRPEASKGDKVVAFFKIEAETLTLGGIRSPDSTADWPKRFEETVDTMTGRYELRRVRTAETRRGG